jgi:hypothetical protein
MTEIEMLAKVDAREIYGDDDVVPEGEGVIPEVREIARTESCRTVDHYIVITAPVFYRGRLVRDVGDRLKLYPFEVESAYNGADIYDVPTGVNIGKSHYRVLKVITRYDTVVTETTLPID